MNQILCNEYGVDILSELSCPFLAKKENPSLYRRTLRQEQKIKDHKALQQFTNNVKAQWPQIVSREVVWHCLHNYHQGTQWSLPPPCAVCSRQIFDLENVPVLVPHQHKTPPLHLDMLVVTDPFIIQYCIVQCLSADFIFGHDALDCLMLYKDSVHVSLSGDAIVDICLHCHSSLTKAEMPKFALANHLYRGSLPSQFSDITWVEEMVCA